MTQAEVDRLVAIHAWIRRVRPWALAWDRFIQITGLTWRIPGLTIYGFGTAMHGAWNLRTPWGWLCFAWPWLGRADTSFGPYVYWSPDGTPARARWKWGDA